MKEKHLLPEQINATRTLLIDDERDIEADVVCRSFQAGLNALYVGGPWKTLYLDHDLASYDEKGNEKTGYDIACWLEENPSHAPTEIICVSSNPVGKKKIEMAINNIYKQRGLKCK